MFLSKILKAADHPMLMGKGGRMVNFLSLGICSQISFFPFLTDFSDLTFGSLQPNNEIRKMQGMNLASLRHHVALQVGLLAGYRVDLVHLVYLAYLVYSGIFWYILV